MSRRGRPHWATRRHRNKWSWAGTPGRLSMINRLLQLLAELLAHQPPAHASFFARPRGKGTTARDGLGSG